MASTSAPRGSTIACATLSVAPTGSTLALAARRPDRPIAKAARLDIDLAASALRGRLDFDGIRRLDAQLDLDSTSWRPVRRSRRQRRDRGRTAAHHRYLAGREPRPCHRVRATCARRTPGGSQLLGFGGRRCRTMSTSRPQAEMMTRGRCTARRRADCGWRRAIVRDRRDRPRVRSRRGARGPATGRPAERLAHRRLRRSGEVRAKGSVPLALDETFELRFEGMPCSSRCVAGGVTRPSGTGRVDLSGRCRGAAPLRRRQRSK